MSADAEDDDSLIRRTAAGDRDALRALYDRHHDGLRAFIFGRCGDEALTADVVQDAFLEVWRGAGRYAGAASVKTWMFSIARNRLADRFRKDGRLSLFDEPPEMEDDADGPEAAAIASQEAGRVRACLDALKEAHRSALRLAFYEELTYEQIGEIEGAPVGTIKTRVHHAKRLLLRCLGGR
ncbi:MAG: sigma-70 family RNA polymerase sigma factor [Pseudomonadota bacterium]